MSHLLSKYSWEFLSPLELFYCYVWNETDVQCCENLFVELLFCIYPHLPIRRPLQWFKINKHSQNNIRNIEEMFREKIDVTLLQKIFYRLQILTTWLSDLVIEFQRNCIFPHKNDLSDQSSSITELIHGKAVLHLSNSCYCTN